MLRLSLIILAVTITSLSFGSEIDSSTYAKKLYSKITSSFPSPTIQNQMKLLIDQGKNEEAALLALNTKAFLDTNGVQIAMSYTTTGYLNGNWDIFTAYILGMIKDNIISDIPFKVLSTDRHYEFDTSTGVEAFRTNSDNNYTQAQIGNISPWDSLNRVGSLQPLLQNLPTYESQGAAIRGQMARDMIDGGTNRRVIQHALQTFLCTPITKIMDPSRPGVVRRDVNTVVDNPKLFATYCIGCHSAIDPFSAMACKFDFNNNRVSYRTQNNCVNKYNSQVNPNGVQYNSDEWVLGLNNGSTANWGWFGSTSGKGLAAGMATLENTRLYGECVAKRTFKQFCSQDVDEIGTDQDKALIKSAGADFMSNNYDFKKLAAKIAVHCTE